jgi:hypothetical protein
MEPLLSLLQRPGPARILFAILVIALPTGWMARAAIPAPVAVPLALGLLTLPLFWSMRRDRDDGSLLASAVRTSIVLLAALGIVGTAGLGPVTAGSTLCAAIALAILFGGGARPIGRPAGAWFFAVGLLFALVAWRPLALTLSSDAPGHVAAILDAFEAGRLHPPDSFPGATGSDPRFGVLHGTYAMVAHWTGASAEDVLRWAALYFSPLFLIGHATLIRRLGTGERVALLIALLFTVYAGAGRFFGLSSAAFPGSVSQSLCALALAGMVQGGQRLSATALLALTVIIHPFAWWATTLVMFCASAILWIGKSTRIEARPWAIWASWTLLAGTTLLLPRILARAAQDDSLHAQIQEVVFVGGGLFFADPLWVFRWGGVGSVLALPAMILLLLMVPGWFDRKESRVGLAIAVPVWIVSLNPLIAPLAWSVVSYLVVRLGRIVLTTWVWSTLAVEGIRRARKRGRAAIPAAALALLGIWGLATEISIVGLHLRQPQVVDSSRTPDRLEGLARQMNDLDRRLVAAPRIGYGIRARGGPVLSMVPVAHASPNDSELMGRIARWRELHDPSLTDQELQDRLGEFGRAALLVDERTEEIHAGIRPYAYVPDRARATALRNRLVALGVPVLASGDRWTLFDLPEGTPPTRPVAPDTEAAPFALGEVSPARVEAAPGESLPLRVELLATGSNSAIPQRIFLRLEGEMPPTPAFAESFSKLWRKITVDRSGRSLHRFGRWVAPADLVVPPSRWPEGRWSQKVVVRIPEWAPPGTYTIQPTLHDWTWHEQFDLRDYLDNQDRFSADPVAIVRIGD